MNHTADEHSRAISFMNSYFSLIDGLASGLENHLAENVILDWFGKTIRGKRNVSTFIKKNKVDSRHMFASIKPIDGIRYKENRSYRKRDFPESKEKNIEYKETEIASETCEISDTAFEENETDWKKVPREEENDMTYVFDEGDLCNLFKFHMTGSDIKEIEECINRVKLEEEMAPMIGFVKREYDQEEDGSGLDQIGCEIKYVEAVGQVKFSRKYWRKDVYNRYNTVSLKNRNWHHPCKLQIAYSILKERRTSISSTDSCRYFQSSAERKLFQEHHKKLPSLKEITTLGNRLVPNDNDFGGYLKNFDFYSDRNFFLKYLRNEIPGKEGTSFLKGYTRNKLIFNRPTANLTCDDSNNNENKKESVNFVFNYQIHIIIYENECKSRDNPHTCV